jgi:two-component system, OmpR family, response regulator
MNVLIFIPPCTLQESVSSVLTTAKFSVETAESAKECLECARLGEYEAILLGVDHENYGDVLIVVELLRQRQPYATLFIFERNLDLDQRLRLFDAGVDDCVREPFFPQELAVRLGASIRLRQAASNLSESGTEVNMLRSGDLELNLVRREVTRGGKPIDLLPKEFLLLEYLVRNANRSVTRSMILEHVWNSTFEGLTNLVDVYISGLRSKVDRGFSQKLIQTNRGVGYTFTSGVSAGPPTK